MSYLGGFLGLRSSASGLGGSLGIGTSIAGLGGQVGSGQATATLIAQWKMNEVTGTTWADSSGNGYTMNANPAGNSTTLPGYAAAAQIFNNSQRNGVLAAGSIPAFNFPLTQAWSVSAWVYYTNGSGASAQVIGVLDTSNSYCGWAVQLNGNEIIPVYNGSAGGSLGVVTNTSGTAAPFTTTFLLTVTYDGSGTAAGFNVYNNGTSLAKTPITTLTGSVSSTAALTIASIPGNPFNNAVVGIMCDLRVYTGVLSSSAISALYSAGPA